MSGLVTARQMGADYPFQDSEAKKWFNFYGRLMYGWRFRREGVMEARCRPSAAVQSLEAFDRALVEQALIGILRRYFDGLLQQAAGLLPVFAFI